MARYDRELRVRVNGDPALARLFVAEGRKYVDAVLEDMRLGGNAVGARRLVNAAGVMFRVLSMGSVPILEIDVTAVQPASDVVPAFMVWPGTTVDQHAFGETPQVLLAPLTNGEWRALFADVDSKPEGTSGRLYSQMFDAGFTRVGNVDWTRSDGRYSVSWYGPRSRYFVARRASTFLETLANPDAADESAYGDHQRHAEVFYKGSLLIDIETVSESLIDEADVYIRGAAIRETDDALYLIVVAAKYGGDDAQEFDSYEIDIHDYVLRFTLTPNSAVSSSLAVVADSGLLLEERIGLFEYESDHPWFFNDDVTEARAIRFLTDEDFDVNYVREVKLTVAANASEAEFEDIETAVIPTAVESESTDSTDGSSVFPSKIDQLHGDPAAFTAFVHPFVQDPVDSETGVDANGLPVPWFFEGIAEAVFYAVAPAVGSVTSTTTRSLAQAEFKIAVDWNGSEWVYAYSLGVDETRTEADSTNRQLTECYYSEVIDPAEPIGSSAGSVSTPTVLPHAAVNGAANTSASATVFQ